MTTAEIDRIAKGVPAASADRFEEQGVIAPPSPFEAVVAPKSNQYQVGLLTPYDGGNLGDGSIQDAMIENLRRRLRGVQLSGISLSSTDFLKQHGVESFPLSETDRPFYRLIRSAAAEASRIDHASDQAARQMARPIRLAKAILRRVPFLKDGVKIARLGRKEMRHWIASYRFLRNQDMVIVSGGGQLDEEWGGPWGHPFALFKWAVLARIAGVPYAMASIGVGKVQSAASRLMISTALHLARYRSYRDKNSRRLAGKLLRRTSIDPVVPDLALGLSTSDFQNSGRIRSLAAGRTVVAISPIAFARPYSWPKADSAHYCRYLDQLALAMSVLLQRNYFIVLVFSSRGDDESVIPELLERLDDQAKQRIEHQIDVPQIVRWQDYVSAIREADILIASRLHSTILGFVAHRPTIAISFDPKVDWVMEDLDQADYLLHIRDFVSDDLIGAIDRLQLSRKQVTEKIVKNQLRNTSALAVQYDHLARLVKCHHRS